MLGQFSYLEMYLGSVIFLFVFEFYLRSRRGAALNNGSIPKELQGKLDAQEYESIKKHNLFKNNFGYFSDTYSTTQSMILLYYSPLLWSQSVQFCKTTFNQSSEYAAMVVFMTILSCCNQVVGLPVAMYNEFVVEKEFTNHTLGSYFKETLKKWILFEIVLNTILFLGFVAILNSMGENAWFYIWIFLSVFIIGFNFAYPIYLAPLFNKFDPIANEHIKVAVDHLIAATGLSCKEVYEVDGSKQSGHSNAYVGGMCGSKRIVIYDTLINDLDSNVPLIKAVVGHEIGHSIMHHTYILLAMNIAFFAVAFWSFGLMQYNNAVAISFGYDAELVTSFIRFSIFMQILTGSILPLWNIVSNSVVRQLEFAADRYAVDLSLDISEALATITIKNKGGLNTDWLDSLVHHNHPPLLERIRAAQAHATTRKKGE